MISLLAKLVLFPLQLLAVAGLMFLGALWLQTEAMDGSQLRDGLRAALAQATGRGVRAGKVDIDFSWPPRVVIRNLVVASEGGRGVSMLLVARVEADLNPWHFVFGGRTIRVARFVNPQILIERDRRGRMNWVGGEAGLARALSRAAKIIGARKVVISGGRLTVRDLRRGSTTVINLGGMELETGGPPR